MVKVEPDVWDFQTVGQTRSDSGSGASDQSQLWTDKSSDAADQTSFLLIHDVRHVSPEQQGNTPPVDDLPFLQGKETDGLMHSGHRPLMRMQSGSSDLTPAPELQDERHLQAVAADGYSPAMDRTQEFGVFGFDTGASGNDEGSCGGDASRHKCFICLNCRQSFDSFSLFERHQCKNNRAIVHW